MRKAGGHQVSARGDDVFAVFERAPEAVEGALAIQRAMQTGGWPGGVDARLRIGLHRGRPALTDTGYVGLSVHAAARICFSAHGGQIIMSSAVRAAVLDPPPEGIGLKSLGAWRFRGLPEPLDMFQVEARRPARRTSRRCGRPSPSSDEAHSSDIRTSIDWAAALAETCALSHDMRR